MMVLWRSAIARAIMVAALAAIFISGELLWIGSRTTASSHAAGGWNGVDLALGAGSPLGECQFFSSAPPALTASGPYPCRMDASRGTYVDIDNASLAVTQSGSWSVTSLAPFGNSDAQSGVANSLWGEALYNGSTYDRAREGSVLGSQLVTVGGTLPAFASTPTFNCGTGCGGAPPFSGSSDAQATGANQAVGGEVFNGSTWDRAREGSVLGSELATLGGTLPAFAATPTFLAQPMVGTTYPAIGTAPNSGGVSACTNIIPTVASAPSLPTVLVDVNFISPTALQPGSSLEIFDESTATCSTGGTKIVLSTGQIGAGYKLGSPIILTAGLSYIIRNPGSFTFGTGYGVRFRTVP